MAASRQLTTKKFGATGLFHLGCDESVESGRGAHYKLSDLWCGHGNKHRMKRVLAVTINELLELSLPGESGGN